MNIDDIDTTKIMIDKMAESADNAYSANDALKFSQAALNLAHALATVIACKKEEERNDA